MKIFKYLICCFICLFFLQLKNSFAETIVYINMDKIMQVTKAGKSATEKLNKINKANIKKFKKIEEDLKKEEVDIVSKRNVLSQEEFEKKINTLKKKIDEYREKRAKAIDDVTKQRISITADFAQKIKPILAEYADKNSIDMVIQKKNIIMGKSKLDITDEILKIVDSKISKLKSN